MRDTGLMHVRVDAKRRLYRVDLQRLAEVRAALDDLWGDRLDALKTRRSRQSTDSASPGAVRVNLVDKRVFIAASPARVYELLTDAELLVQWMAPHAELDPRPGGALTWTHVNGDSVARRIRRARPGRRIVFTYGWDRDRRLHPAGLDNRGDRPASP